MMTTPSITTNTPAHWFRTYQERIGFPDDYVTLDLLRTGNSTGLILGYDLCIVRNRQIETEEHTLLNWVTDPYVNQLWLARQLHKTIGRLADRDYSQLFTYSDLARAPDEPDVVLPALWRRLEELPVTTPIVGTKIDSDLWFLKDSLEVMDESQGDDDLEQMDESPGDDPEQIDDSFRHNLALREKAYDKIQNQCLDVRLMDRASKLVDRLPTREHPIRLFPNCDRGCCGVTRSLAECLTEHVGPPPHGPATRAAFAHLLLEAYRRQAEGSEPSRTASAGKEGLELQDARLRTTPTAQYCRACRDKERELFGKVACHPCKRHTAAVRLAECDHAP